jgi:hypothetical protein
VFKCVVEGAELMFLCPLTQNFEEMFSCSAEGFLESLFIPHVKILEFLTSHDLEIVVQFTLPKSYIARGELLVFLHKML